MYAWSGHMGCYEEKAWNNPSSVHACLYENYGDNLYGGVHDCSLVLYDSDGGYNRYASECFNNKGYETYVIYTKARCPSGERFNSSTISCEPKCDYGSNEDGSCKNKCEFAQAVGHTADLSWFPMATGNDVQFGCYYTGGINAEYCTMQQTGENEVRCTGVVDGHVTAETRCTTQFSYTGSTCTEGDEPFWGDGKGTGNPEEPDNPDEPDVPDEPEEPDNSDEPEEPDNDGPDLDIPSFDPPVSDSDLPPILTPDEPDVEEPDTDDNSGVITAITGQNKDINKNFSNLITSNNANLTMLNVKLQTLNANTVALNNNVGTQLRQDYDIYKLEKQNREKQTDALKRRFRKRTSASLNLSALITKSYKRNLSCLLRRFNLA